MTKDWVGNKDAIWRMLGASNHSDKGRQPEDFYATDPKALELFSSKFHIAHKVWECACGNGALSEWLKAHGHDVLSTDLVNRGYGIQDVNFLNVARTSMFVNEWSGGGALTSSPIRPTALLQSLSFIRLTLFPMTVM